MDELQISGRRFISSRRIARDNGYTADYIGQLIRGGKIKGQKVGRTWYVDAESFDAYLGGEATAPQNPPLRRDEHDPYSSAEDPASPKVQPPAPVIAPAPVQVSAQEEVKRVVVAEVPVVQEIKEEQKVEIKKVAEPVVAQARYVPVASGGLRFVADDDPLLPEIAPKKAITRVMPAAVAEVAPAESQTEEAVVFEHRPRRARLMFALGGLAVLIFIFSAVVSSAMFEKINVEAGNPASVEYGINW